jgi:UDP-glucose 4-epimerase
MDSSSNEYILVTGGAGYIGSHTCLSLLEKNNQIIVLDNLSNSSIESIQRVKQLTGKDIMFIEGDILDDTTLDEIFTSYTISGVIHFAALKAVGESTEKPLLYYQNNVSGTLSLLSAMQKHDINNFIFSSSATVYGIEAEVPYLETMPLGTPSSPYGTCKVIVEQVIHDMSLSNPEFRAISLRYFNPIGAHESGQIGEDPNGIPNNLLPFISQVAIGKREVLSIFGGDYSTKDGTCERDYLHVMDLAEGHTAALDWLATHDKFRGVEIFNLGTGNALSVLEIVQAFEEYTGQKINYQIVARRDGDLPAFWADATKANTELKWQASRSLQQMIDDTWRWQSKNPDGY